MYYAGSGVPQDVKTAAKWFTLAAAQGHADAQFQLGFMYKEGRGLPQDKEAAVKWYTRAADQLHDGAQLNLGVMYARGEGVPQNDVYAHMWSNIAASQGYPGAAEHRERAARKMTSSQIERSQELVWKFFRPSDHKDFSRYLARLRKENKR